jgi:hypothetical protein
MVDVNSEFNNQTKNLGKQFYKNLHPEFWSHFQKQQEDSILMFASTQET